MSAWPQCTMCYDGTFDGFLSCVGESYLRKVYPFYFITPETEQFGLYPMEEVDTDPQLARRVYRALGEKLSPDFRQLITYSFLTCLTQRERHMYDLIHAGFLGSLPQDVTDPRLLTLTRAVQRMHGEAHLLKGFVRFSQYGALLVGEITPENRVLPLLRAHFCTRLAGEAFLLYDKTHREGLFYDRRTWKIRPVERLTLDRPEQAELECRALWRQFYETVAIPSRYNPGLRRSNMPKRYWANMTEFQKDDAP